MDLDRGKRKGEGFEIRHGRPEDLPALVGLFAEMDYSRLHDLGDRFVALLHRHIIKSPYGVCLVAEKNGEALGYITGTIDGPRFSRQFLLRYGWLAALMLAPRVVIPRKLKVVWRCLTYFPEQRFGDQTSSGLTFAVRHDQKRQGIGTELFKELMRVYRDAGVEVFTFLTAGEPGAAAIDFYKSLGFEYLGTQPFYKDSRASVYRCRLK